VEVLGIAMEDQMPGNDLKQRVEYFADWDYNIKVAGVKFRQNELGELYGKDWNKVVITCVPEPDNKYDANAIKILADDVHIGYFPANVAEAFSDAEKSDYFNNIKCALIYVTSGDGGKFITAKIALKEN
jgi:hypothetical protein